MKLARKMTSKSICNLIANAYKIGEDKKFSIISQRTQHIYNKYTEEKKKKKTKNRTLYRENFHKT